MPRTVLFTQNFLVVFMPVGKGVRGGSLEPPFWPPNDFIQHLALVFVSGPLALLPFNITVQVNLVAAMYFVCT